MARVLFSRDFNFKPSGARLVRIKYRAGEAHTVKRECADAAKSAGAAVELEPPSRPQEGGEDV